MEMEKESVSTEEFLHIDDNNKGNALSQGVFNFLSSSYDGLSNVEDIEALVKANNFNIDTLIKAQALKAGAVGFATGLPGLTAIAATLPANFAGNLYNQLRMIAGIAYIRGYDLQQENVKTMALVCLVGEAATTVVKDIAGESVKQVIKMITEILLKQAGSKVVGKMVPLIGGIVGGTVDTISTYTIGKVAKSIFPEKKLDNNLENNNQEIAGNIKI